MSERLLRDLQTVVVTFETLSDWAVKHLLAKEQMVFGRLFKCALQWPETRVVIETNLMVRRKYLGDVAAWTILLDGDALKTRIAMLMQVDENVIGCISAHARHDDRYQSDLDAYAKAVRDAREERDNSFKHLQKRWSEIVAVRIAIAMSEAGLDGQDSTKSDIRDLIRNVMLDIKALRHYRDICISSTEVPNAPSLDQLLLPR